MARWSVTVWIGAVLLLGVAQLATAADVVVGNGTAASCSEAAFDAGLTPAHIGVGGTMSFNCGGPAAIVFTSQKAISKNIVVAGAGLVSLSGGNTTRLFNVLASGTLTLRAIALSNGFAASDGGAISSVGAVVIENSTIRNSHTTSAFSGGAIISYGPLTITGSRSRAIPAVAAGPSSCASKPATPTSRTARCAITRPSVPPVAGVAEFWSGMAPTLPFTA